MPDSKNEILEELARTESVLQVIRDAVAELEALETPNESDRVALKTFKEILSKVEPAHTQNKKVYALLTSSESDLIEQ